MTQTLYMPPAVYIQTDKALRRVVQSLEQADLLAIDTESNSLYAYQEQVCLLQLSTRERDYIIDPLTINDMKPLAGLFANPRIEKIFHAADYDIIGLKRDFQFEVFNVFDTMIAARLCGIDAPGLNTLLETFFDVKVDKRHQRDNWGKRPLPADSLTYAQADTHYLSRLRDILYEKLLENGLLEEALEASNEACYISPNSSEFDPDGYWPIGRSQHLSRRQMAILKAVYLAREDIARQYNRPPFKVLGNATLVTLARQTPATMEELSRIKGVGERLLKHKGAAILEAVAAGNNAHPPRPPRYKPPAPPRVMQRYAALRQWRRLRADERGVTSELIISKNLLWELAQQAPRNQEDLQNISGLGPWKRSQYGDEILAVLREY
ncbi:MAG: HRDC domain-containing protein [Anaerolineae bacterium]|nr:HRDC domain-containing protein [Anaerolineae bacterium]